MTNRNKLLNSMKKHVQEGIKTKCRYLQDGDCCVVGYALRDLGMSDDELQQLGAISVSAIHDYVAEYNSPIFVKARNLISDSGISIVEWDSLQYANDHMDTEVLMDRLDKMIVLTVESEA